MFPIILFALLSEMQSPESQHIITIDTTKVIREVSPRLWGVFFEEINHSGDGGLYAEMVRNRSFEDNRVPEGCIIQGDNFESPTGWKLPLRDQATPMTGWVPAPWGSDMVVGLEERFPLNSASPTCARVAVNALGDKGCAGVANVGFWGMSVSAGQRYELSLFTRAESGYTGRLLAALESEDGSKTYGSTELPGPGAAWEKRSATLASNASDHSARLALYLDAPGIVYFDMVSLFPGQVYKDRANGLRPDLAEMVANLKPAFIRFPGGCIVEGFTPESAWNWKETVGDTAVRPGRQNLWGYRASDGFGYHEMLQFAEDIGAEPIVVVNCGITCQGRGPVFQPLDKMEVFVRNALDAIEYANGGPKTKWGTERANNGHPEPFNLKYITIGNENSGPEYVARYGIMAEAVRRTFPDIRIISNDRMEGAPVDLEEHHYYMTPGWFAANANKYDRYDRTRPRVFVSEFAANQACGVGNLEAAVGESMFMMGLENNSDIVDMAAYAPLFCHHNNREWPVNLIVFDNHRVYGTPSYYAQRLFAENRPDVLFETSAPTLCEEKAWNTGAIGLGTWNTCAEFKDVEVSRQGESLYAWNPDQQLEGWSPGGGDWKVREGAIRQERIGTNCTIQGGDISWKDYTLRLKARKISGDEGFLILFRVKDLKNLFWLNLGGWNNTAHGVECFVDDGRAGAYERKAGAIETGRWYDIEITVEGNRYCILLDGVPLFEQTMEPVESSGVMVNAGLIRATGEYVVKVANYLDEPCTLDVCLRGCEGPVRGVMTVLHSAARTDENSLDAPLKVMPKTTPFHSESTVFTQEFPPCSLTVFRMKTAV